MALASDTNISTDGITGNGTVNVAGLESGATWQYSTDSGNTWKSGNGSSLTLTAGTYAANAVKVKQMDVAGNVSPVASLATVVTVDTTAPAAPAFALASDTNITTDGITRNGSITLSGLEAGATWQYSTDGGTHWSIGIGASFALVTGTYAADAVKVKQTDVAGNVSAVASNTGVIIVDSTAPAAPSLDLASDTNISSDGITSNASVNVTGLEAGATWEYSTDGGLNWSNGSGSSFTLVVGTYPANAVKVKQTDVAGNVSSAGVNISAMTVDTSASAPSFALASDTNSTTDGITSNGSINVTGLEAGATWQYSTDGGTHWSNGTGTSFLLGAGTYAANAVKVKQTDLAGNTSAAVGNATAISVGITSQDAPTVLPNWITSPAYGAKSTTTTDLMSPQAAISSLLINDGDSASWLAKADDAAARPAGASLNGTPLELSYAFQNAGASYLDGQNVAHTINGSFSDGAKSFMRSVFSYFAQVANIKFTESTSQLSADNGGGGADIRIFTDTAAALGSQTSTLGFAYQPTSNDPKASDRNGNFFMVSDAQGLSGTPFQRPYDDAKNTVVHELAHSLGFDHPFADGTGSPGFDWYGSTANNTVYSNHLGVQTGGGHDTPATDYMLETIMTYQNPYKGVEFNQSGVTSSTNTPWKLGVYDIAALQHLYGANMAYNIGNDTYTYSSDQVVFDTIWDAGGSGDLISQTGDRSALIDLRGGDHFSRVGLYGGAEYDFSKPDIEKSNGKTMTGMKVQYQLDNGTFVDTGILTTPTDTTWHWISDPLIPAGKTATATLSFSDGATLGLPIPAALPDASMAYNLGIAFGVVIEQASGGSGDDVLVNNIADNILFGNAGRDTFVYFDYAGASNGNDVIKDFQDGIDKLEIVKTPTGNVAGVGTAFANATDAAKYFAAVQSGSDTKVTLYDGLATGSNNVVGSVTLSNFLVANLTYEDFKVI